MTGTKYPIFKCLHRGQKGFTLIELLIVVAILGIVAGVVIPNATAYFDRGKTEAMQTELDTVQTAMFAGMSDAKVSAVAEQGDFTNTLTSIPTECPLGPYLSKNGVTKYYYKWNTAGTVSQNETA